MNIVNILKGENKKVMEKSNNKIISPVLISKKIADMNNFLVDFWGDDRWDIRKCPHPLAIEIAKRPSLRNRWVNFDRDEL